MGRLQYIPSFYFSKFAQLISGPYTAFDAYHSGIIDEDGNIVKNESSIDPFEYFVIKLKRIFDQLPPGMTRYKLNNIIGTMQVFSEEASNYGISKEEFDILMEAEITSRELMEDMGTSSVAGGIGTPANAPGANQGNISGYDPVMAPMQTRSGPVNMINSVEMFAIPSSEFSMIKKTNSYPNTPTSNYIRRYGLRNSNKKLAIKDEETGEIHWLPAPKKKTFVEQFFLERLDLLNESAVSDYTDSVTDGEVNVATVPNSKEKKIAGGVKPLELTQQNVARVFEKGIEKFGKYEKPADIAEKGVTIQDIVKSVPGLYAAGKSGSEGEAEAARALGMLDYLSDRAVSTSDPFDSLVADWNRHRNRLDLIYRDTKTPTATAKISTRRLGNIEFPKVDNISAPEAATMAKLFGNKGEHERIRTEIIKPFINRPEIRTALRDAFVDIHREKEQMLMDPSKILVPGQKLSVGIVRLPGQAPVEVDMGDFGKDLEQGKWRFGVKIGGAGSLTPEVSGGKYSSYRGWTLPQQFSLDPSMLRNLSPETSQNIEKFFAKLRR